MHHYSENLSLLAENRGERVPATHHLTSQTLQGHRIHGDLARLFVDPQLHIVSIRPSGRRILVELGIAVTPNDQIRCHEFADGVKQALNSGNHFQIRQWPETDDELLMRYQRVELPGELGADTTGVEIGCFPLNRINPLNTRPLTALFGLTHNEAELAVHISNGMSLEQCAELRCRALETVRSTLKNIYRKTNVNRQSALGALVQRIYRVAELA